MARILVIPLLALMLAPGWAAAAPAAAPTDSKAWGNATTTGPPRPGAIEAQRAKLAELEAIARGLKPLPGAGALVRPPLPGGLPAGAKPASFGTSRPLTGAELAACEARIRQKREAWAHRAPTGPPPVQRGALPAKPPEVSTSLPLTREELARSLALQRAKRAVAPPATRPPQDRP